jgi:hypothetical protein
LFLFTALHALAHPVAHVSCVTHRRKNLQPFESSLTGSPKRLLGSARIYENSCYFAKQLLRSQGKLL